MPLHNVISLANKCVEAKQKELENKTQYDSEILKLLIKAIQNNPRLI